MNWLDYILCFSLVIAIISGFKRGFARTIAGFITLFVATLAAIWMYGTAASFFLEYVSHRAIASLLGFFVVFGFVMAIGTIVGIIVQRTLKAVGLGWLDRLLGAGVGFV